jgi:hypothetical protein
MGCGPIHSARSGSGSTGSRPAGLSVGALAAFAALAALAAWAPAPSPGRDPERRAAALAAIGFGRGGAAGSGGAEGVVTAAGMALGAAGLLAVQSAAL